MPTPARRPRPRPLPTLLTLILALVLIPAWAHADFTLSDNLSQPTGGAETTTDVTPGDTTLAASFGTGFSAATLTSITLLLASPSGATAELDLYSDGGLQPGSLLGTLTSPSTLSTTAADATFTTSGLALDPNTTYWAVLKANTGELDWSWSLSNTGTGDGFQGTWATSDDGGQTWFSYDAYPFQLAVNAASAAAVPEPNSLALLGLGAASGFALRRRQRSNPGPFRS